MDDHPDHRPVADNPSPPDPDALLLSKDYRVLLVFAAVIGVLVSLASWGYLELVHYLQEWLYKDLPNGLDLLPCQRGGRCPCWPSPRYPSPSP